MFSAYISNITRTTRYSFACEVNKSISSGVPPKRPLKVFGTRRTFFSFPAARPKGPFCPARPNTVSGAPSPSPVHRGRSRHAGHNEKRGEEWRDRRVSDSPTKRRSFALMATEGQARRLIGAAQPPHVACVRTPPRVLPAPPLLASSRATFPPLPLLATPASIKGLPRSMVATTTADTPLSAASTSLVAYTPPSQ